MGLARGAGGAGEGLGALGGRLTASEKSLVSNVLADARNEMYDRGYHWEPGKPFSQQPPDIQEATGRFVDRAVQRVVHDRGHQLFSHDPETRSQIEDDLHRAVMEKLEPPKRAAARASRPRTKQSSELLPEVEPVANATEKPDLMSIERLLAALAGAGTVAGGAYALSRQHDAKP